jgi:hypothetical protein
MFGEDCRRPEETASSLNRIQTFADSRHLRLGGAADIAASVDNTQSQYPRLGGVTDCKQYKEICKYPEVSANYCQV